MIYITTIIVEYDSVRRLQCTPNLFAGFQAFKFDAVIDS